MEGAEKELSEPGQKWINESLSRSLGSFNKAHNGFTQTWQALATQLQKPHLKAAEPLKRLALFAAPMKQDLEKWESLPTPHPDDSRTRIRRQHVPFVHRPHCQPTHHKVTQTQWLREDRTRASLWCQLRRYTAFDPFWFPDSWSSCLTWLLRMHTFLLSLDDFPRHVLQLPTWSPGVHLLLRLALTSGLPSLVSFAWSWLFWPTHSHREGTKFLTGLYHLPSLCIYLSIRAVCISLGFCRCASVVTMRESTMASNGHYSFSNKRDSLLSLRNNRGGGQGGLSETILLLKRFLH